MNKLLSSARLFATEDDGAQIVEYALIIGVVTLTLAIAIRDITGPRFSGFIDRVEVCLMTSICF
jgi:pilus assembly protein Flp/PilA